MKAFSSIPIFLFFLLTSCDKEREAYDVIVHENNGQSRRYTDVKIKRNSKDFIEFELGKTTIVHSGEYSLRKYTPIKQHVELPGEERSFLGVTFCWCPPGKTFIHYGDTPVLVELKGFWISKYEITQAQYKKVIGTNPSHFEGIELPVESVSWVDSLEYCKRVSDYRSVRFRLPSIAQWQYACLAGSTTKFSFGDSLDSAKTNLGNGSRTERGGTYEPNSWGIHDMHGNVAEWCREWYDSDTDDTKKEGNDGTYDYWKFDIDLNELTLKDVTLKDLNILATSGGGSFHSPEDHHDPRTSIFQHVSRKENDTGFRVVVEP